MGITNHSWTSREPTWSKSFLTVLFLIGIPLVVVIIWLNQEPSRVFRLSSKALIIPAFAYLAILFFHGARRKTGRSKTGRGAHPPGSAHSKPRIIAPTLFAVAALVAIYELITNSDCSASGLLGFLAFLSLGLWIDPIWPESGRE